ADGPDQRPDAQREHGVLQAGRPGRHRRAGGAHDDGQGLRRARSGRPGRAAGDLARRVHLERGGQRDRRARAPHPPHAEARPGRAGHEEGLMHAFEYASPTTKEQAVEMLGPSAGESAVLAGGTDLLALMKDDVLTPKRVVDINGIEELRGVRLDKMGLRLGALVTFEELLDHAEFRKAYPSLWTAVEGVRSPQVRNLGTVGGDLCQRPRCWYYRSGFGLLAQDGGKSMVVDGDNRYHAIFGGGPAYFVSPSSLGPALIALGGTVKVFGPKGARDVPAEAFFR